MKSNLLLLTLISLFFQSNAQSIERVDPPNWWTGMYHSQIQVMVYGEKVANLRPAINYPNVTLEKAILVQSPNYLFLDVQIGADAKPGEVKIEFYNGDQVAAIHNFPIYERKAGRAELKGFDASDAIYLITPDRFVNGDESNDSMADMKEKVDRSNKGGRHGGDIAGLRQSLDYIKDLGFTAVWLNPVLENDMETYSYHGYSTTDFYKVDPRFGSNEAYQVMAEEADSKGLKLIMDMIVNHCGSEHWWMKDLPSKDWINQWPTYTGTNHRKTLLQDPYASDLDKKVFTDGWFVETMPDLNQRNPMMAQYLIQNSIWWVEFLGLAGIRMDTYPYPDMDFMGDWTRAVMKEYPNLNIVGEEWFESPTIVSYWQKGKHNPNGYTSDLKSVMDFPLQIAVTSALNSESSWKSGWITVYEMLAHDYLYPDPMNLVVFPDNHDMARIYAQLNGDYELFKQAIAFYITIRGIPQLYYGTEILVRGPANGDHGLLRSDFPGGWKGDKVNAFTGDGLTKLQKEAKNYVSKLLHWRQTATAIHNGKLKHFIPQDGVYVYFRYNEEQKIMVVFNKNEKETALGLKRFAEILDGETAGTDVISTKKHELNGTIQVAANSVTILELK